MESWAGWTGLERAEGKQSSSPQVEGLGDYWPVLHGEHVARQGAEHGGIPLGDVIGERERMWREERLWRG